MKRIPIDRIEVGTHRRALKDLKALASSIEDVGLLNPITVRKDGNGSYRLVAGYHRLEACKAIGWLEIDATIVDLTDNQAALAEIDENLIRNELTKLERGELLSERKAIYEDIHPDAPKGHGGDRKSSDTVSLDSFTSDTAAKTGETQRSIQRLVQIARDIPQDVRDVLRDTPVADSTTDLLTIARQPVEVQREIAVKVAAGEDATKALKSITLQRIRGEQEAQRRDDPDKPLVTLACWDEWLPTQPDCDLLITDPPYMTDVEDIDAFASRWLNVALAKVKPTGRAYVCIGAYPDEIHAYLNAYENSGASIKLEQILVWAYRNTMGPSPTHKYKQNWQAILYFIGPDAPRLDCPLLVEAFSVQDINAPTNSEGDKYHTWQKPDELAERLIRHSTCAGDLVLDPFAGTGTFLLAATRLGRVARGCDVSPDMVGFAEKRGCDRDAE